MNLSKNFTLEELIRTSSTLPNQPSAKELTNLKHLTTQLLQPLRDLWGKPIRVNSGYRSIAVNRAMGGATKPLSQHCKGEAADIESTDNAALFHLIRTHFDFDQLIWEGGDVQQPAWVHVSFKSVGNRKQILQMKQIGGTKRYEPYMI